MTGAEHCRAAEGLLGQGCEYGCPGCERKARAIARAQVHATLALAAATGVNSASKDERQEWQRVAGTGI
jgi:hypothetical protein